MCPDWDLTRDLLVHRLALNPLSNTSQGSSPFWDEQERRPKHMTLPWLLLWLRLGQLRSFVWWLWMWTKKHGALVAVGSYFVNMRKPRKRKTDSRELCLHLEKWAVFFHYWANVLSLLFKIIWVFDYPKYHDTCPLLPCKLVFPFSLRTYINPLFTLYVYCPKHTLPIPTSTFVCHSSA